MKPWKMDWPTILYANQRATRNQPVNDRLYSVLQSAARAAGIDAVRVFSGGQPSSGPNRVGSHRHDHGNSADINLIVGGRTLNFENPADRQTIQAFVSAARAAGATGIGAGINYMGPTSIHVGFGKPAVWGAGGRAINAPSWLVEAYNARPGQFQPMAYAAAGPQAPGQRAINAAFQPPPQSRAPFAPVPVPIPNARAEIARNLAAPPMPPKTDPLDDRFADAFGRPPAPAFPPLMPQPGAGGPAMPGPDFPFPWLQPKPDQDGVAAIIARAMAAQAAPPPLPPGRPAIPMPGAQRPGAMGGVAGMPPLPQPRPGGRGAPGQPGFAGAPSFGGGPANPPGVSRGIGYQGPPGGLSLINDYTSPWLFEPPVYGGFGFFGR